MNDYESPIIAGKNIVVGQAAVLWGDAFHHPDKGHIAGGWILPGCIRTINGEHALQVCRALNDSIKQSNSQNRPQNIGEIIRQQIMAREA